MRNNKGITLIALIVTIIAMLILVGVTINVTIGQNGLISNTREGKIKYDIENEKETIAVASSTAKMQGFSENRDGTITYDNLLRELENIVGVDKVIVTGSEPVFMVKFVDSNREYVVENGNGKLLDENITNPYEGHACTSQFEIGAINSNDIIASLYDKGDNKYDLVISGNGATKDFYDSENQSESTAEFATYNIENVYILDGVTKIGKNILAGNNSIKTVEGASTLIEIGPRAFYKCENLNTVIIPNMEIMGYTAFAYCSSLKTVIMPKYKRNEGNSQFYHCTSLENIYLPELKGISASMFKECSNLVNVETSKVTQIMDTAFGYCSSLKTINIQDVREISAWAFIYCESLENVNIQNAQRIGEQCFYECTSLTSIEMPNVTLLENLAFGRNINLVNISMPKIDEIGNNAFYKCTSLRKIYLPTTLNCIPIDIGSGVFSFQCSDDASDSPFRECSNELQIYCGASEKPIGWGEKWNYYNSTSELTVLYNITQEQYDQIQL